MSVVCQTLCLAIFGTQHQEQLVLRSLKSQPGNRFKGNSFATTIAPVHSASHFGERKAVLPENGSTIRSICVCCSQSHSLEECQQFKGKKHQDKITLLKEKELCFGCLCAGHMSHNCTK